MDNAKRGPVVDISQIPTNVRVYFYIGVAFAAGVSAGIKLIFFPDN